MFAKKMPSNKSSTLSIVISVIGAVAGYAAVQFMGLNRFAILVGAGLAGAICGLLPFLLHRKKKAKFAKISLWVCIGSGLILGALLALPMAIILTAVGYVIDPESGANEPPKLEPPGA